jgi:hypothetical protein
MNKLERLRQEREQVGTLLQNARLYSDTREVLERLAADLDHQIDEELTHLLSQSHSATDSEAA